MSINESEIFEENDIYINGNRFLSTVNNIFKEFNKHSTELQTTLSNSDLNDLYETLK
jgi:hypothetical protein